MKNLGFCESMENLTILEVQKNMFTWKKPLKHLRKKHRVSSHFDGF